MTRLLAVLLLLGSVLLLAASAFHPILPLTGAGDLALIAATPHWALVHYTLLHATGLIIAGIWAVWLDARREARPALTAACVTLAIGHALNGVNIAYMTGAGTLLAAAPATPDLALTYQALHQFAVMCGRLAGFLVAIAAAGLALATRSSAPRALTALAWLACGAGLLGNVLAPPGHPLMLTSVGVMAAWQAAMAWRVLRG
ncbi:MAG: hypothetical protein IPK12_05190 [Gemmatimonadetes bacterium]|nr:hypothetical protein [Gemmatimonadota bacterium]